MRDSGGPVHDLEFVRLQMATGKYVLPARVKRYLRRQGWDEEFAIECMTALDEADFHKSAAHQQRPGVWLDIYRPRMRGQRIYVKFTLFEDGERVLVLSLCIDGSAH